AFRLSRRDVGDNATSRLRLDPADPGVPRRTGHPRDVLRARMGRRAGAGTDPGDRRRRPRARLARLRTRPADAALARRLPPRRPASAYLGMRSRAAARPGAEAGGNLPPLQQPPAHAPTLAPPRRPTPARRRPLLLRPRLPGRRDRDEFRERSDSPTLAARRWI